MADQNTTHSTIPKSALRDHTFPEEIRERARLLEYICWISAFTSGLTIVSLMVAHSISGRINWPELIPGTIITFYSMLILLFVRAGKVMTSTLMMVVGGIVFTSHLIYAWEGVYSPFPIYYAVTILMAATFLNIRATLIFALVCIAVYSTLILGQMAHWLPEPGRFLHRDMTIIALIGHNGSFIVVALLAQMLAWLVASRGKAVAENERRYRELVETAPDMILTFDSNGTVVDVNQRACDVLGYKREELLGILGTKLVRPEDRKTVSVYFESLMKTGSPRMIEVDMVDRGGIPIPVEVNHAVIMKDGKPVGLRAMARETSSRRHMQVEQNKLRERLILSEKLASLGQLVLGISHEFNNILGGLRGMADVARMPGRESRLSELPASIIQMVDRAQQVTESLLGFAKRFEPTLSELPISDIVEDVYKLTCAGLNMHHINFIRDVPDDLKIYTEAGKLQEVLLNLVINAQHAMESGGTLKISASTDNKFVRITVSDTGTGITPENLTRIFDPFFTTKGPIGGGDQPGTGLGLSLSYGIIQSLGGDISVESKMGKGSVFTVILPHRSSETIGEKEEKPVVAEPPKEGETAGRRVLIVEDEPAIRETLAEFLEASGHSVTTVCDGEEGLKALDRGRFDIAFVDLLMPLVPGEEFLHRAHQKQPELAYVIITGREISGDEKYERLHDFPNVRAVLRKPFPFERAAEIIAELPPQIGR